MRSLDVKARALAFRAAVAGVGQNAYSGEIPAETRLHLFAQSLGQWLSGVCVQCVGDTRRDVCRSGCRIGGLALDGPVAFLFLVAIETRGAGALALEHGGRELIATAALQRACGIDLPRG
jgi:hypothetical protein